MATEKQLNEPLPCCGVTPWGFQINADYGLRHYRMLCHKCGFIVHASTKEKAIDKWNEKMVAGLWELKNG